MKIQDLKTFKEFLAKYEPILKLDEIHPMVFLNHSINIKYENGGIEDIDKDDFIFNYDDDFAGNEILHIDTNLFN